MSRVEQLSVRFAQRLNWVAAGSVAAMMLLTSADVLLRLIRRPIPGTYEIVGLLGAVGISFALAYTSVEQGHIAVDVLVRKLRPGLRRLVEVVNTSCAIVLFSVICRQCALCAAELKLSGEVSLTLQMPTYPYVYGIAIGCGCFCAVLAVQLAGSIRSLVTT